jgi:hypothetical protein
MDTALVNTLWNLLDSIFNGGGQSWGRLLEWTAVGHLSLSRDTLPCHDEFEARRWIRERFFSDGWWERCNFLEFIVENSKEITRDLFTPEEPFQAGSVTSQASVPCGRTPTNAFGEQSWCRSLPHRASTVSGRHCPRSAVPWRLRRMIRRSCSVTGLRFSAAATCLLIASMQPSRVENA